MRIWAAGILLAFLIPVVAVTTANATHSTHGTHPGLEKGMITFTQTGTVSGPTKLNQHTTIVTVKETLTFTGNLTGTALTIQREVQHNVTDEGVRVIVTTFHGSGNFTGTLNGSSVTLHIRYEGVENSTFTRGNFVVSGDTSTNADVHGEGHFRGALSIPVEGGPSSGVSYTMHSHVATHTEHVEARDKDSNAQRD